MWLLWRCRRLTLIIQHHSWVRTGRGARPPRRPGSARCWTGRRPPVPRTLPREATSAPGRLQQRNPFTSRSPATRNAYQAAELFRPRQPSPHTRSPNDSKRSAWVAQSQSHVKFLCRTALSQQLKDLYTEYEAPVIKAQSLPWPHIIHKAPPRQNQEGWHGAPEAER